MMKWSWWKSLPLGPWRVAGRVDAADEIPAAIPNSRAIVVGSAERPKWLAFDCPCKSGHRVLVSLDAQQVPHWVVEDTDAALTLWPSIDWMDGTRRCHFTMTRGRVRWVKQRRRHGT